MIERVVSLEQLDGLRQQWDDLVSRCERTSPFVTHAWVRTWLSHFVGEGFCALVRRDRPGELSSAAVFIRRGHTLSFLDQHSYLPAVIHAPETPPPLPEILSDLVGSQRARSIRVQLEEHAGFAARLDAACRRSGVVWIAGDSFPLHAIDTSSSFDDYLRALGKKVRRELRRKARRMEREVPGVKLVPLAGPAKAAAAHAAISAVERDSWKAAEGTAIVSDEREHRFYRSVLDIAEPAWGARTFVLVDGNEPVAHVTGVVRGGIYYALKTSYRRSYAAVAPGQVLFYWLVRSFCLPESGIQRVELLGRDSRWKRDLATSEQRWREVEFYPRSVASMLRAFAWRRVRPAVLEAVERDERLRRGWERTRGLRRRIAGESEKE